MDNQIESNRFVKGLQSVPYFESVLSIEDTIHLQNSPQGNIGIYRVSKRRPAFGSARAAPLFPAQEPYILHNYSKIACPAMFADNLTSLVSLSPSSHIAYQLSFGIDKLLERRIHAYPLVHPVIAKQQPKPELNHSKTPTIFPLNTLILKSPPSIPSPPIPVDSVSQVKFKFSIITVIKRTCQAYTCSIYRHELHTRHPPHERMQSEFESEDLGPPLGTT
ncbi:hypothetical protein C8R44DRAFT_856659 [Mycena epipterygia]|nr:hypothetical protein C8R44DRAFT_856659 [Mycena epipterygia]